MAYPKGKQKPEELYLRAIATTVVRDVKAKVNQEARKQGVTVSHFLRGIITEWAEHITLEKKPDENQIELF